MKTSEGEWISAKPVENAILLNSGQLLEYWTGGHFHAAVRFTLRQQLSLYCAQVILIGFAINYNSHIE